MYRNIESDNVFRYLENFNIIPCGLEKDRPPFFKEMIVNINKFKNLYNTWANRVNELSRKKIDLYNRTAKIKRTFKPVEPKFLNNSRTLTSKFIYNQFLNEFKIEPKLSSNLSMDEKEIIFNSLHKLIPSSNVKITNYKLLFNALPTNKRFNNRYDNKCYLCNKQVDEDITHLYDKIKMLT